MMKKILMALLATAMIVTLFACGGGNTQPTGTVTEITTEAAAEVTENGVTEASTEVATDATENVQTEAAGDDADATFEAGVVEGTVYENEYLNIGFKVPEGWAPYTEEQMAEVNGIVAQSSENAASQLETTGYIYDFMAGEVDGANNVNVIVQNLNVLQSLALANNIEESLQATEEDLVKALEGMGAENIEFKVDRGQTFPAKEYACGVIKGELMGMEMFERIVLFKVDNYLSSVTAASFGEDKTAEIINAFYALK